MGIIGIGSICTDAFCQCYVELDLNASPFDGEVFRIVSAPKLFLSLG